MKKKLLALITTTMISAPTVFAFHEADTDHLASGMPVVFTATGLKFTPQQHSELRAIAQTWYSSECFMSSQIDMDVLVDKAGNGTVIMRWPTKESYMADQKTLAEPSQPMGICESLGNMQMLLGKLHAANGGNPRNDLITSIMTAIASSPR